MTIRRAVNALRRNGMSRHWWIRQFNVQVGGRVLGAFEDSGVNVMAQDWDTLVILDACRYDLFEEVVTDKYLFSRALNSVVSRGTGTPEFLRKNFTGGHHPDTVYVSANPFVLSEIDEVFHHVEHVWLNGWDYELETVSPETVLTRALELHERFDDKRVIVHFMQPHYPFIGETRIESDRGFVGARSKALGNEVPDMKFIWEQIRDGDLDPETVWEAYRDNLRAVLPAVTELVNSVNGKCVVTSDHGNAFGEQLGPFPTTVFGHGPRLRIPALYEVPWYEVESEERREIQSGSVASSSPDEDLSDEVVEDRLESLGYLT